MRVKILKTAAGPRGVFVQGQVGDWPEDILQGLEYEVLEAGPAAIVVEAAVPDDEVEMAVVEVHAKPRRGRPPRGSRK